VSFTSRVNLNFVNGMTGSLLVDSIPSLRGWGQGHTMETVLVDIRREMASSHNKKLVQPEEGTTFESGK